MAGILANSATVSMLSGASAVDQSVTGYISGEAVALTTSPAPAGATYSWGLSRPSGSAAKAALSDDDGASVTFTPDVAGYYVVTVTVNSTTDYVLRISVTQIAQTTSYEAIRFSPKATASVPAPTVGHAVFANSTDSNVLTRKTSAGALQCLENRAITPSGIADAAGNTGDVAYDSNYIYVKTAAGWKRAALITF